MDKQEAMESFAFPDKIRINNLLFLLFHDPIILRETAFSPAVLLLRLLQKAFLFPLNTTTPRGIEGKQIGLLGTLNLQLSCTLATLAKT